MSELRQIVISLPDNLLKEADYFISLVNKNRNDFICDAMKSYLKEMQKSLIKEQLKNGYLQMAELNAQFAEIGLCEDFKDFVIYETRLSGRE